MWDLLRFVSMCAFELLCINGRETILCNRKKNIEEVLGKKDLQR